MYEIVERQLEEQASKVFIACQVKPTITGVELPLYQFTDEQIAWMHEVKVFQDSSRVTIRAGVVFNLDTPSASSQPLFIAKVIEDSRATITSSLYEFSLNEYEMMIRAGILTKYDKTELLEGVIVVKARKSIEHDYILDYLSSILIPLRNHEWHARNQSTLRLARTEVEPDFEFLRGPSRNYMRRLPEATDVSLVIEIADTYLDKDKLTKTYLYAHNRIPNYWIFNLIDHCLEMYELEDNLNGPHYRPREIKTSRDVVNVEVFGKIYGQIDLAELFAA